MSRIIILILNSRRHRWRQFTLRGLFLFVSLLAAFLAYNVNWIHKRHEAQQKHRPLDGRIIVMGGTLSRTDYVVRPSFCDAPWPLRLMGEKGCSTILIRQDTWPQTEAEAAEWQRVESLFPEAEVRSVPDNIVWTPPDL